MNTKKRVLAYFSAATLSSLLLTVIMRLWRADLFVSFGYEGDGLFNSAIIKGLIDNGWYLRNPILGAPLGADLYGYPMSDLFNFLIIKAIGTLTRSWAATLNLFFLATFPLVSISAMFVFLKCRIRTLVALVCALIYTFIPYHLLRGEAHLFLSAYYMVPVICWMALNMFEEGGYLFNSGRISYKSVSKGKILAVLFFSFLAASTGAYYAFFGMLFILFAGTVASLNRKNCANLVSALILTCLMAGMVMLNILPNLVDQLLHSQSPHILRSAIESEIYGLKISQLLLPRTGHNFPFFASLRDAYNRAAPLVTENDMSALGMVSAIGLMLSLSTVFLFRRDIQSNYGRIGLLNLFAVLLSTIGGGAVFIAYLITKQIRAYNRISIFIAFLSLLFVAHLLSELYEKYAVTAKRRFISAAALFALLLFAIYDQVPIRWGSYTLYQEKVASDKKFFSAVESALGKDSSVFQLPYFPFPETPPLNKITDYEHFRGYLNTRGVKWSYGAFKGSYADAIIKSIGYKTGQDLLDTLVVMGYNGLFIDRFGYADSGAEIEGQIKQIIAKRPLENDDGRFALYDLTVYRKEFIRKNGDIAAKRNAILKDRALGLYLLGEWITNTDDRYLTSGWSVDEGTHRWSQGRFANIEFKLNTLKAGPVMKLVLVPKMVVGLQHVLVFVNGKKAGDMLMDAPREYLLDIDTGLLKPDAVNCITFKLPNAKHIGGDPRLLAVALGKAGLFYPDDAQNRLKFLEPVMSTYSPGKWIDQNDGEFLISGWSKNEKTHRWSEGHNARIGFILKELPPSSSIDLVIVPSMVMGWQYAEIFINGQKAGATLFHGSKEYRIKFRTDLLKKNAANEILLSFPRPKSAKNDQRLLAVAIGKLGLF
ncbi:MAG: hypothetical protein WBE75_05950 [Candidatus Omnitrophota bacterium]